MISWDVELMNTERTTPPVTLIATFAEHPYASTERLFECGVEAAMDSAKSVDLTAEGLFSHGEVARYQAMTASGVVDDGVECGIYRCDTNPNLPIL